MINWFKNRDADRDEEQGLLAAYGAVLERCFEEHGHEGIFDINWLPAPKSMLKAELVEAIEQDPNDKALIHCYMYLAQFQPPSDDEEKREQAVDDERDILLKELDKL